MRDAFETFEWLPPDQVTERRDLTATAKLVYRVLYEWYHATPPAPRIADLVRRSGAGERTVFRALHKLFARELIPPELRRSGLANTPRDRRKKTIVEAIDD